MRKRTQKKILTVLIVIIIILIGLQQVTPKFQKYLERKRIDRQNIETMESITKEDVIIKGDITTENESPLLNDSAYLEVQFICQAPLETEENWTSHEESCEEAALLQAYLYETGQTLTKQEAHNEILEMIAWQEENLGGHHDIYAEELKEFAMGFYQIQDFQMEIIIDASIEDIKQQISMGHPVIVPITGEILQNPYYPHPGYHMLTVIGYTKDKIITNDNGTRRGKDFSYDNEIFKEAMEDAGGDILILQL